MDVIESFRVATSVTPLYNNCGKLLDVFSRVSEFSGLHFCRSRVAQWGLSACLSRYGWGGHVIWTI